MSALIDSIIKASINGRHLVVAGALIILFGGWLTFKDLPVDVFPDLNRPTVTIMTEAEGLAPEEVETLVSLPIESILGGLPQVERVRSSSAVGLSIVYVEFGWNTDIFRNRQLVSEKLALAKERLPKNILPVLGPITSVMGEIQLVGLASQTVPGLELRTLADWTLRPRLMSVPGVAQVTVIGGGVKQKQILISAEKLQHFRLTLEDVEHNLGHLSQNTTGGMIDLEGKELLIRNLGTVRSKEDIESSVVGMHLGNPVTVSQIARVEDGPQFSRGDAGIDGKTGVILSIQKQPGASTIQMTSQLDLALSEIEKALPKGVELRRDLFKQATFIQSAIDNVKEALRDGLFLVVVILFVFLVNTRATLITLTAIPISMALTVYFLKAFGVGINTMTLGGFAIAIGELVDDAVVDVENIFRRLRENSRLSAPRPVFDVIYSASTEIRNSIVYATLVVVIVFFPLFYLGGIEGRLFIPLGVAYVTSIMASLFVSVTLTPALCAFFFSVGEKQPDGALVRTLKRWDRTALTYLLDRPRQVAVVATLLLLGALALIPRIGSEFLPKFNEGTATINVIASPGVSLAESNRLGTKAEQLLLNVDEVKSTARRTGRAELDEHAEGVHYSEIDVDFKPRYGRSRTEVLTDIRSRLETIENVSISVGQPISHRLDHLLSGVKAQIAIKIFGPDLGVLRAKAAEVRRAVENVKGLVDVQAEQQVLVPQIKIQILRPEAARFGIVIGDLATMLQMALHGEVVAQVPEGQKIINVFMRFDDQSRSNLELIKKTLIKIMPDGSSVRLEQVADVYESQGPNLIQRENSLRRIVVSANVSGVSLDRAVSQIKERISGIKLPDGYFSHLEGQYESQSKAAQKIFWLSIMALVAVLMLLYSHFGSLTITFQIMLNIPMAMIGSLIAIYLTDRVFSVATLVALVTLCGIASRNGIMMISHFIHLMKVEGETFSKEMVIRGSLERLVPVLMTASTASLALIPLILTKGEPGKEILHPVAVVIVGGLLSSTLLDIFVTPVIYYWRGNAKSNK